MNQNELLPGRFESLKKENNDFLISTETECILRVRVRTDHIVQITYAPEGGFESEFSYGISNRFNGTVKTLSYRNQPLFVEISTSALKININKIDLKISFTDLSGRIICRDEKGFHWEENQKDGGYFVKMSKVIQEGEHYYGMGDKTMHLNLRGRRVVNWATDTYGFKKYEDPIYKCIPFYTAIQESFGYGIFFDNTFKSHFDFGSERRAVTSFWADGGEMNYYFIYGPELIDVTRRYTMLTGVPDLPPLWALGYQQCKWSYYPESKVMEVTKKLRDLSIPCDAFYLDIDYMDGFRCFTWDKNKFPDPKAMVKRLKEDGFKTIVIIDPGIKIDPNYSVFKEGLANNFFCRRADGPYMKGKVWPGDCYFPEFTNPRVRKWWSGLFQELIEDTGVRGVWNDMNEPALFEVDSKTFPDDVRHDYDGHPCSHRKAHNIYGMQMAKATYKGLKRFNQNQRPLVITRSAYAGTQRYAAAWTGDNIASWEHLWVANMQCQRMSISGYSFVGTDIGGFTEHPTPELFVRWMQLAVFHPFFRTHSSGDHGEQEPWSFGEEALGIVRKFIELRYRLLPYVYSTFYQYVAEGTPMIRPISVEDQHDHDTLYRVDEFLLGDHILACPVLEPNVVSRYVYLPKGTWYSYWDDEMFEGGKEIKASAALDQIPVFIRGGAVIPHFPVMQFVGQVKVEQLTLHCYYGQNETESLLYEDDGDGYDYEKGIYNIKIFRTISLQDQFQLSLETKGHYETSYSIYKIVLHGLPFKPSTVFVNENQISEDRVVFENELPVIILNKMTFLNLRVVK
ncbi:MAG: glycoside hydrolase family 31 protein [Saprospiraceae bacterium]|nr:glycoside hydrolase family 31 protein [Saprospiraceae bacterium]